MGKARLYDRPEVTREVLRLILKGSDTQEELADKLGCSPQTVYNKIHDARILGFLERIDGRYVIKDKEELMKLLQLDNRKVLKNRFESMPAVEEIKDELVGGSLTYKRVGRIVSYYTNSEAIDEDAFMTYGRIYSEWFQYIGIGYSFSQRLYREKPANYERKSTVRRSGDGFPSIRPPRIFEALDIVDGGIEGRSEIASNFGISENHADNFLGTLYSLDLARRDDKVDLTDRGRKIKTASESVRKDLIRDALLDIEVVKTYCELAPDTPFNNQQLMGQVGEELGRNWNSTTTQTRAKRIYQWLLYSELFKEVKKGVLVPAASADRDPVQSKIVPE